jgi:uncharacterized membrane protein
MAGEKMAAKPAAEAKPAVEAKPAAEPKPAAPKSDSNLIAALCYIIAPWVSLFVLFTDKKNDKFALFHAWQALVLIVVVFAYIIGLVILGFVIGLIAGPLACIVFPLWLLPLVVALFAAWKAYQGEKYILPVIGDFANSQAMK